METIKQNSDAFDENQSLQVIKEMIQVSQKKLKNDGILFILWGWISFLTYMLEFVVQSVPHTYQITLFKGYTTIVLAVFGLGFSIIYIYRKSRKASTYIGISLRYVWVSMFAGMVLINLIQANVLHKITFELQLPIFMVLVSFALVVTGGILRYKMIIAGGIIFGLMAYLASFFSLHQQLLIEAIAWVIGFIIPGHILYSKRNR
jgi:hypothetical protein